MPSLLRFLLKVMFDVAVKNAAAHLSAPHKLSGDTLTLKATGYELKRPLL